MLRNRAYSALAIFLVGAMMAVAPSAQGQQTSRPMFLTGEVVMADGSPLPERVPIEMVCQGQEQPQGRTDPQGGFGFQIGSNRGTTPNDAAQRTPSTTSSFGGPVTGREQVVGMAESSLIGCGVRAVLEGYSSSVIELSGRRAADSPEIGTIVLTKLGETEGTEVSATSLDAPRDALRAYERGVEQIGRQRFEQAETQLSRAVEIYPDYAEAWQELGVVQQAQGKMEDALPSFEKAIEIDPKFVKPYLHLSLLAARAQNWPETANYSDTLIQLDPYNYAEAYYYSAVAHYNLQDFEKALASADKTVELDTTRQIPLAEQLLAVLLEMSGNLEGAAEHWRAFIQYAPETFNLDAAKTRLAEIESQLGQGGTAQ